MPFKSNPVLMNVPFAKINPSESRYMPQLDSLRTLAVFAVMYYHFFQVSQEGIVQLGYSGVTLFFVLSGFLITGILLKSREDIEKNHDFKSHLKKFYARRMLRIFPLYYAVVIIGTLLSLPKMHDTFVWNLTYTSNVYYALTGVWDRPDAHFWTLSIEEQFYLVWPFIVLLAPRKYFLFSIQMAVLMSIVFRAMVYIRGLDGILNLLTVGHTWALAAGAYLALFQREKPEQFQNLASKPAYNWGAACLVLVALITSGARFFFPVMYPISSAFPPLLAFWLIHRASIGFPGDVGRFLEWKPLIACGKISYGIYVYHLFIPVLLPPIFQFFHIAYPQNIYLLTAIFVVVSLIVAALSWHFFEKPINNLKRYFPYERAKTIIALEG